MNSRDVMKWGNETVMRSIRGVPLDAWNEPGVCGVWSVRQIMAHLTSFEWVLMAALKTTIEPNAPAPYLDKFIELGGARFNDYEVGSRDTQAPEETLAEYKAAHEEVMNLASRLPDEAFKQNGSLPWYGAAYDLDDLLVYQYYGHKREHMAQVDRFRDHVVKARNGR